MKNKADYKQELYAIANTLLLYYPTMSSLGFTEGRLGVAAFFYEFSEFSEQEQYKSIADDGLRELFVRFKTKKIALFNLFEIGLGLSYMIKNGSIREDFSSLLREIDKMLTNFKPEIVKNIHANSKLAWTGVYVLNNLEENEPLNAKLINKTFDIFENFTVFTHLSINEINAILYFLLTVAEIRAYANRAEQLLKNIDAALFSNNSRHLDYGYHILVDSFTDSVETIQNCLPNLQHHLMGNLERDDATSIFLKESFHSLVFNSKSHSRDFKPNMRIIINEKQSKITDNSFSINNGLAGIGLALLR